MTLEEIMAEADKFGYALVEKSSIPEPLVKPLLCTCGQSKRVRKHIGDWRRHKPNDKYYSFYMFCEKCGKEGPHIWYEDHEYSTQRQMENMAREAWNKMIKDETVKNEEGDNKL